MTDLKKIYLVRHGETESNRKGIFRGRLDIPLSETGRTQARDLRSYFEKIAIDEVYSSPLQRAVETAQTAFPGHMPVTEPWLNNLDLGEWSGKSKGAIKENFPGKWEEWTTRPESIRFPGGEELADVYRRAGNYWEKITASDTQTVAAVSHRSVVKVMLAYAAGLEHNYYWKFHLDNASVSLVFYEKNRGFTLVKVNDTHHLGGMVMEWY